MGLRGGPAVGLAVLALCLAACSDGQQAPAQPTAAEASEPTSTTEAAPSTESPVPDGAHSWPDGITATVVQVTAGPAVEPDDPAQDTELRIVVEFSNEGDEVLSFGPSPNTIDAGPETSLLYGTNRTEAQGWYFGENKLPTQLAPGTTAAWTAVFTLPGAELGELALSVSPTDMHEPWIFTEVETRLA